MIYFFNFAYTPNTAPENRMQSYYHALDKMNVKATVVYIHPDNHYSRVHTRYKNISIEYLWNPYMLYRGPFRKLTLYRYIQTFLKRLKDGDIVYTYNVSLLTKMCEEIKGVRVFAERTEHPKASDGFPNPLLSLSDSEIIKTLKKLTGLFVISKPLKEYYEGQEIDPLKIHIINMTVDADRFKGIKKVPNSEKHIAYCGTASNNKDGVDQLMKAFALVVKRHPEYKLYIIGSIPSKKQRFGNYDLARELGIENSVVFTGSIPATQIPQMLKNAEILALDRPDNLQAKYGFPTKLGEYLLTGNPVVITKVGDIPLFLKDEESALLAAPNNAQDFANKICWAIDNPEKAKAIGENGKNVAKRSFNYLTETKKLVDIIQNMK